MKKKAVKREKEKLLNVLCICGVSSFIEKRKEHFFRQNIIFIKGSSF